MGENTTRHAMRIEIFRLANFGAGAERRARRLTVTRAGVLFKAFGRMICCFWRAA